MDSPIIVMDLLSWLLVSWIAVCGAIFLFVQNVLPIFIPPPKHISDTTAASKLRKPTESYESYEVRDTFGKSEIHHQSQVHSSSYGVVEPSSTISSWASSAIGMVKGVGGAGKGGQQGGGGESSEWVNNLMTWLHRHIRQSPDVTNAWLRAMNDASNKLAMSLGCDVYFEEATATDGLSERRDQDAPKLSGIRSEFGPREHLVTRTDSSGPANAACDGPFDALQTLHTHLNYPKLHMRLVASQKLPDRLIVSNYEAVLKDLKGEAQVRMACVQNELYLMVSFEGKPDVVITLENSDKHASERVDPNLVDEIIKRCLGTAVTNICLGKPQQINGHVSSDRGGHELMSGEEVLVNQANTLQERLRSRRLLLKVQRAEKLGGGDTPSQPYVVVELDEPAQKHETTLSLNAHPIWEEQFLYDLNERSEEILFEVYDRKTDFYGKMLDPRFLGLAIVGIEELRQSSNLTHTLALQSRPYKNDSVSGTLEVEFVFLRDARGKRGEYDDTGPMVKSVSQYVDGSDQQYRQEQSTRNKPNAASSLPHQSNDVYNNAGTIGGASTLPPQHPTAAATPDRGRKRERSFFADLKRKLSFGKSREKRAQSLEADIDGRRGQNNFSSSHTQEPRSISTPPSRDASRTRRPDQTPLASDSEMSVTSNDSVFPQSQLVVEVADNGIKKYYLVPTPVQRHAIGKKIIKSGKKLHIYNSHTFTATKTPPGSTCAVCKRSIATGFRRKGYQCRDCGFICHKRCHFKTESFCPSDKIANLPIEVVKLN